MKVSIQKMKDGEMVSLGFLFLDKGGVTFSPKDSPALQRIARTPVLDEEGWEHINAKDNPQEFLAALPFTYRSVYLMAVPEHEKNRSGEKSLSVPQIKPSRIFRNRKALTRSKEQDDPRKPPEPIQKPLEAPSEAPGSPPEAFQEQEGTEPPVLEQEGSEAEPEAQIKPPKLPSRERKGPSGSEPPFEERIPAELRQDESQERELQRREESQSPSPMSQEHLRSVLDSHPVIKPKFTSPDQCDFFQQYIHETVSSPRDMARMNPATMKQEESFLQKLVRMFRRSTGTRIAHPFLTGVCKESGMDALPQVLDDKVMKLVQDWGETKVFRGLTQASQTRQFMDEEAFYGNGDIGAGIYVTQNAVWGASPEQSMSDLGVVEASKYGKYVLKMLIKKNANFAHYEDIRPQQLEHMKKLRSDYDLASRRGREKEMNILRNQIIILQDTGVWAALHGINGYYDDLRPYVVVLNRSCLRVQRSLVR